MNDTNDMFDMSNPTDISDANDDAKEELIEDFSASESVEPIPSIDELNQTIASLKEELDTYKAEAARQEAIARQINEFSELFPDISVRAICGQFKNICYGNGFLCGGSSLFILSGNISGVRGHL